MAINTLTGQQRHKLRRASAGKIRVGDLVQIQSELRVEYVVLVKTNGRAFPAAGPSAAVEVDRTVAGTHVLDAHVR